MVLPKLLKPDVESLRSLLKTSEKESKVYYCGTCGVKYKDSNESEYSIGCDKCDTWYHSQCVHISKETEPDSFYCSLCV